MHAWSRTHRRRRYALVPLAVSLIALGLLAACGDDDPVPATTVTVTASPSVSTDASASATPSPTPSPVKSLSVIAVAAGPQENALTVVVPTTKKTRTLVPAKAGAITGIAWSPDRARIAYSQLKSSSSGDESLWVYDLATKKASPVRVAGGTPKSIAGFTWLAPTRVLCAVMVGATTYHTNGQMYVCDVAKGNSAQLKDDKGAVVRGIWPSAAADFTTITYVRYGPPAGATQPESLMAYDAGTRQLTKVAHDALPTDYDNDSFVYPSLSPDGSHVFTVRTGSDPGFGMTVLEIGGTPLFEKGALVWPTPCAWDATTGRLAFGGTKGSSWNTGTVWTWTTGATAAKALYSVKKRIVDSVAWSPTGAYLAFSVSPVAGGTGDLWVVGAAGGGPHLVLKNAGEPAWAKAAVPGL